MKKLKIHIVAAISLLFVLFGCSEDFLKTESRDSMTFQVAIADLDGLEGSVLGIYERGRFIYSENDFCLYKIFYTDIVKPGTHISDQRPWNEMATFQGFDPTNSSIETIWAGYYSGISRCNTIIENIDQVDYNPQNPSENSRRNTVLGEAYYFRAYFHLNLVEYWDNIPMRDKLINDPDEAKASKASEKSEVYNLIVSDLETAIGLLPESENVISKGKVSKGVARHLLSLAHLDLGNYAEAAEYAEEVIADDAYALADLEQIFSVTDQENSEIIFSWQFREGDADARSRTQMQLVPLYDRCNGVTRTFEQGGRPWARMSVSEYYWTLFEENDLRLEAWHKRYWTYDEASDENILPEGVVAGDTVTAENIDPTLDLGMLLVEPTTKKYWEGAELGREVAMAEGFRNMIQFRLAEAYLVAAEGYMRTGTNTARGQELFDAIRDRAGLDPIALNEANLLDEQARELGHEGRRYPMLKRLGILLERVQAHSPGVGEYMQAHHVRWPIPQIEVDLTEIEQNPEY